MIRLTVVRRQLGLTQEQLATAIEVSQPTYSRIEQRGKLVDNSTLLKLVNVLGWTDDPHKLLEEVK